MTVPASLERRLLPAERRAVGLVAAVAVARTLGLFMLLPVLAIWAGDLEGATPMLVGLAVGAYGITQACLQLPLGAISDRLGRVPVVLGGLAVFAAGSVVAALAESIGYVILGRLLQGGGAVSATLSALLADATRPEVRTRGMAVYGIGIGAAFMGSLVLGPMLAALFGVRGLFWLAAGLGIAAMALIAAGRAGGALPAHIESPGRSGRRPAAGPEPAPAPGAHRASPLDPRQPPSAARRQSALPGVRQSVAQGDAAGDRAAWRHAFAPRLLALDAAVFLLHLLLTAIFVAAPFLLRDTLSIPLDAQWQVYLAALALSLAGAIPLIFAAERGAGGSALIVALLCMTGGQALIAVAGTVLPAVLAGLAVFFAGFNFLEARLPAEVSLRAGDRGRGAALGVFASAQFLGAFAGGALGGWWLGLVSPRGAIAVLAAIAALWLVAVVGARFTRPGPDLPV